MTLPVPGRRAGAALSPLPSDRTRPWWDPLAEGLSAPDRPGDAPAATLMLVAADGLDAWLATAGRGARDLLAAQGLEPGLPATVRKAGRLAVLAGGSATGEATARHLGLVRDPAALGPWCLAPFAEALPPGRYRLETPDGAVDPDQAALGWMLAQAPRPPWRRAPDGAAGQRGPRVLLTQRPAAINRAAAMARAVAIVRALVDAPANRLGPRELEAVAHAIAARHGGALSVIRGEVLAEGFPLIHAVGRAAARDRQPVLIELVVGPADAPRVAVVGKGITFDTGGLDIKPAAGMALMKKDMGGAAHALALADLVAARRLPIRLHCLIAIAENAVGPDAMRPGDVLPSRHGRTIEIGNTDAEGRLVLADALTRAQEEAPGLILDFATLTGAARVALGPDLPALFANDAALSAALVAAGEAVGDPLWPMPLWRDYADELKSEVADLGNHGASGLAGAVVAALFLDAFVDRSVPFAHIDTFAWSPKARPGRPKGGAALGLLAAFAMLETRCGAGARDGAGGLIAPGGGG